MGSFPGASGNNGAGGAGGHTGAAGMPQGGGGGGGGVFGGGGGGAGASGMNTFNQPTNGAGGGGAGGSSLAPSGSEAYAATRSTRRNCLSLVTGRRTSIEKMIGSRVRRVFQLAPGRMRQRVLERLPREQTAAAVYAGTPSEAHTEALLRGTVFKGVELAEQLDAIVIGIPPTTPSLPRERPNPVNAAYLGLGLALRLWRNAPPLAQGGTAILVHPFARRFARPAPCIR